MFFRYLKLALVVLALPHAGAQEVGRSVVCRPREMELCIRSAYSQWAWRDKNAIECRSYPSGDDICLKTAPDGCGTTVDTGDNSIVGGGIDGQWLVHVNEAAALSPLAALDNSVPTYEAVCLYSRDLSVSTKIEREAAKTVSVVGSGTFDITMSFCLDRLCEKELRQDPLVVPRDMTEMVVQVRTSSPTGFFLDLKHCWTSTSPGDPNAVVVLKDYCSSPTQVMFQTLKKEHDLTRVSYPLFKFSDNPFVYFYCTILICQRENGCYDCDKRGHPSRIEEDTVEAVVESDKGATSDDDERPPDTGDDEGTTMTFGKGPFLVDTARIVLGDDEQEDDTGGRAALVWGLMGFTSFFCIFVFAYLFTRYYHMREGRNPDKYLFMYHMSSMGASRQELAHALPSNDSV